MVSSTILTGAGEDGRIFRNQQVIDLIVVRKPQGHLQCRFFGVLLFFTSILPEAHCVKVWGFNISQISAPHNNSPRQQHTEDSDINHIDKMLEGYRFLTSSINPKVEIILPEEDSEQSSESTLANTDLESMNDIDADLTKMAG